MSKASIRVFVSYKWESESHNLWVRRLATDLRGSGIEVILDVWEVPLGHSFTQYMTTKIHDADVVLFIITGSSVAAIESPGPGGALKFEMELATARSIAGEKLRIIPVYRQGNATPTYLRGKRYIDFRDDSRYRERLDELVTDLLGGNRIPPVVKASSLASAGRKTLRLNIGAKLVVGIIAAAIIASTGWLILLGSPLEDALKSSMRPDATGENATPVGHEVYAEDQEEARPLSARHPYKEELLGRLSENCRSLLIVSWSDFAQSDQGSIFGNNLASDPASDPWLECQNDYLAILLQEYKRRLDKQGTPSLFDDVQSAHKSWEEYQSKHCHEEVFVIGSNGLGAALDYGNCMAREAEERIELISNLNDKVAFYASEDEPD